MAAAPATRANSCTTSTARRPEPEPGVTAHARPSKSCPDAAKGPDRSLPAMGCEPAYLAAPSDSAAARPGSLLTLERSVTIASGHSRSAATTVSLTAEGGTAMTTKPGAPSCPGRHSHSDTAVSSIYVRT